MYINNNYQFKLYINIHFYWLSHHLVEILLITKLVPNVETLKSPLILEIVFIIRCFVSVFFRKTLSDKAASLSKT